VKKILSTPSFGGEIKPSVVDLRHVKDPYVASKSSFRQNYRTTFSPTVPTSATGISHVVADVEAPGGEKWERQKKAGESNCKLPLRTCAGCSVPEPYQSPDWALVSAQTGPRAEYQ